MTIAIDFDGTVVSHEFPRIGKDIGAIPVLKKFIEHGYKLILLTMRDGENLENAIRWFEDNEIPLYDVNKNRSQLKWTTSRKVHADIYIDDQALGIPLTYDPNCRRPYVNWSEVEKLMTQKGLL